MSININSSELKPQHMFVLSILPINFTLSLHHPEWGQVNQSVSHASEAKLLPLVVEGNASKYFFWIFAAPLPAVEAKFDSDCVAKRQNSSNADGIDLIKCWGQIQ